MGGAPTVTPSDARLALMRRKPGYPAWPYDGGPRFIVTKPYVHAPEDDGGRFYRCEVLDRGYCHRVVHVAEMSCGIAGKGGALVRALAEEVAARWERELAA